MSVHHDLRIMERCKGSKNSSTQRIGKLMIMHIYVGTYYSIVIPMNLDFLGGTTVVSLYAELKQYQDIICASCKEKMLLATTRSPQQSALSPSS
jgi:hypothetical protein